MLLSTKHIMRAFIALGLLMALTACGTSNLGSEPTPYMTDYSYVPPADGQYTVVTDYGLESF